MSPVSVTNTLTPPLSSILLAAAHMVQAVLQGRSLTDVLASVDAPLRAATQAVSFHAMRYLGWADAMATELAPRSPAALAGALLRVALSLLKENPDLIPGMPIYAAHTVVDQTVRAAAGHRKLAPYKGFFNGCLRRFLRERASLLATVAKNPVAQWNHPQWWIQRLRQAYPQQWQQLLQAANVPPPLTLRVNQRRVTREQVLAVFERSGIAAQAVGDAGLTLATARPVAQLPGFEAGWWSVQDAGAQLAAPLLAPLAGMRVLDACAAPGGKTAHLLEMANLELLALDADARRLERVAQNLDRLGLAGPQVSLRAADAAKLDTWWDGRLFDAVLADVPCTAAGIVRRHPDIRWLRRDEDIERTAVLQAKIVDALWQTVAPGGRLLYVTCSIFPEEGRVQAAHFLRRHADAEALAAPGQLLPVVVDATSTGQHDGFFYALFAKRR